MVKGLKEGRHLKVSLGTPSPTLLGDRSGQKELAAFQGHHVRKHSEPGSSSNVPTLNLNQRNIDGSVVVVCSQGTNRRSCLGIFKTGSLKEVIK